MKLLNKVKPGSILRLQVLDEYYTVTSVVPEEPAIYATRNGDGDGSPNIRIAENNEGFFFVKNPDIRDVDLSAAKWDWDEPSNGTQALYADGVLAVVLELKDGVSAKRVLAARENMVLLELDEKGSMDIQIMSLAKCDIHDTLDVEAMISGNPVDIMYPEGTTEGMVIITSSFIESGNKTKGVWAWLPEGDLSFLAMERDEKRDIKVYSSNDDFAIVFSKNEAGKSRVYLGYKTVHGPYIQKSMTVDGGVSGFCSTVWGYVLKMEPGNGVYIGHMHSSDKPVYFPDVPLGYDHVIELESYKDRVEAILMNRVRNVVQVVVHKPARKKS